MESASPACVTGKMLINNLGPSLGIMPIGNDLLGLAMVQLASYCRLTLLTGQVTLYSVLNCQRELWVQLLDYLYLKCRERCGDHTDSLCAAQCCA